jgi:hypothetical protein
MDVFEKGQLIRRPKKLKLGKILKLTYEPNENRRKKVLKRFGYIYDTELSTPEHIVGYSPFEKKLLYGVRGTELKSRGNALENKDLQTDILLGAGGLKQSKRYDEERSTILKAKKKYNEDKVVLVGHSLGGGLLNSMPEDVIPAKDAVYTYNAPILKPRKDANNYHYRTSGDVFSVFNSDAKTLPNENQISLRLGDYLLKSHQLENIADAPIFV